MSFKERLFGDGALKQWRIIQRLPKNERVVARRSSDQSRCASGISANRSIIVKFSPL